MIVYLCSPYSSPDPEVREQRYQAAVKMSIDLWKDGIPTYSPIQFSHPVALEVGNGLDWKTWQFFDLRMMEACDEVWIYMLPGWEESIGIRAEIEHARKIGKPVKYVG